MRNNNWNRSIRGLLSHRNQKHSNIYSLRLLSSNLTDRDGKRSPDDLLLKNFESLHIEKSLSPSRFSSKNFNKRLSNTPTDFLGTSNFSSDAKHRKEQSASKANSQQEINANFIVLNSPTDAKKIPNVTSEKSELGLKGLDDLVESSFNFPPPNSSTGIPENRVDLTPQNEETENSKIFEYPSYHPSRTLSTPHPSQHYISESISPDTFTPGYKSNKSSSTLDYETIPKRESRYENQLPIDNNGIHTEEHVESHPGGFSQVHFGLPNKEVLLSHLRTAWEDTLHLHFSKQWKLSAFIIFGVCGVSSALLYIFWDPIKRFAGQEGADLLSNQILANETLHFSASEFSKQLIDNLLNDTRIQETVAQWVQNLFNSSENELSQLAVRILHSPSVLTRIKEIVYTNAIYLSENNDIRTAVSNLLIAAINLPVARQAAADWLIYLFNREDVILAAQDLVNQYIINDESMQQGANDMANQVFQKFLDNPEVTQKTNEFISKVLLEPAFQTMVSDALWSIFKISLSPKWFGPQGNHVNSTSHEKAPTEQLMNNSVHLPDRSEILEKLEALLNEYSKKAPQFNESQVLNKALELVKSLTDEANKSQETSSLSTSTNQMPVDNMTTKKSVEGGQHNPFENSISPYSENLDSNNKTSQDISGRDNKHKTPSNDSNLSIIYSNGNVPHESSNLFLVAKDDNPNAPPNTSHTPSDTPHHSQYTTSQKFLAETHLDTSSDFSTSTFTDNNFDTLSDTIPKDSTEPAPTYNSSTQFPAHSHIDVFIDNVVSPESADVNNMVTNTNLTSLKSNIHDKNMLNQINEGQIDNEYIPSNSSLETAKNNDHKQPYHHPSNIDTVYELPIPIQSNHQAIDYSSSGSYVEENDELLGNKSGRVTPRDTNEINPIDIMSVLESDRIEHSDYKTEIIEKHQKIEGFSRLIDYLKVNISDLYVYPILNEISEYLTDVKSRIYNNLQIIETHVLLACSMSLRYVREKRSQLIFNHHRNDVRTVLLAHTLKQCPLENDIYIQNYQDFTMKEITKILINEYLLLLEIRLLILNYKVSGALEETYYQLQKDANKKKNKV